VTPAVLIFDAACPLCRGAVTWISRRVVRGAIEFLPCQAAERRARFPSIAEAACLEAMHLVLPDERTLAGADALPEILGRLRLKRWRTLAGLVRLPGVRLAAPLIYRRIAGHRYRISRLLSRLSR
jgi:predicted DCC family thiol-disulfide oxidoreductase YuxK